MPTYNQGQFIPRNPQKYIGNPSKIFFRSSWERVFMKWADADPSVLKWGSEELIIPYFCPTDNKMHRYFPDFILSVKDKDTNKIETWLIEIKPHAQTINPSNKKVGSKKKLLYESLQYAKNQAKWKAATNYCINRGWRFVILTEKQLFRK